MKTIKGQPLLSTFEDSHGERRDKQFLIDFLENLPPQIPLWQNHDAALPSTGFIENMSLREVLDSPGNWQIVGDVHLNDDVDFSGFGGFSFSVTQILKSQQDSLGALFVPYPFYRDEVLISEILTYDPQLDAGKWIKKNLDPGKLSIIVSLLAFALTPVWKRTFDEIVWPFLSRSVDKYLKGRLKDNPLDCGFGIKGHKGEDIYVYFVSDRKDVKRTFTKPRFEAGLQKTVDFISGDSKAKNIGVTMIKLYFANDDEGYQIHDVQYADGKTITILK
jgi:hypothetical protein